jgi:hypothetical protein
VTLLSGWLIASGAAARAALKSGTERRIEPPSTKIEKAVLRGSANQNAESS